ncbi:MAG: winged helix-turn-helix transcriptional regulator [Alphaproteobacteria bacterium]
MSSALDLVGDKWSLVIVRSMFAGKTRYGELLEAPEGISTNILADRLKLLEDAGIVERIAGGRGPSRHRYRLTRKGADLLPVLQALARWAGSHIDDRWEPPGWFWKAKPEDFYSGSD